MLPLLISPLEYQYTKETFALVIISLLVALWAVELLTKGVDIRLPWPFLNGLLLLLVAALSLIHSRNPLISLESLGLLLSYMLLYLLLANTVTTERQLRWLLGVLLFAGTLAALYALVQYSGFDLLPYPRRLSPSEARSMISTMGNRNYLAGFLSYLFLPALILFFQAQRWRRALIFIALAIIFTAILAGGTRAAWLGLGVAVLFLSVTTVRFKLSRLVKRNLRWTIALVSVLLLIAVLFILPTPLSERTSIPEQITSGARALSGPYVRYHDWWIAGKMIKDHPLLGVGLGGYKLEFFDYKAKFLQSPRGAKYREMKIAKAAQAHNDYLQTWAELGSLGLLMGLGLIGTIFYSSWRSFRRMEIPPLKSKKRRSALEQELTRKRFIALALQAGIVALLLHALFSFPFHLPASMLEFVLFAALLESGYLTQREAVRLRTRPLKVALSTTLILLALVIGTFTLRDLAAEVHLQRGERLLSAGDVKQAKVELEKSLRLDFAPKQVLFDLGLVYMDSDLVKAEKFFLRSLESSAADLAAYLNLAEIARAQKDYKKALGYIERGREIDPVDPEFLYLQAWLTAQLKRPQEALATLQGLLTGDDGYYRAQGYALAGDIYLYLLQEREKGITSYRRALEEAQAELERLQGWQGQLVEPKRHRQIITRYRELEGLAERLRRALDRLKVRD